MLFYSDDLLLDIHVEFSDVKTTLNPKARTKNLLKSNESQRALGFCSKDAQAGDKVVLILGLPMPLIFRNKADNRIKDSNHTEMKLATDAFDCRGTENVQIICPAIVQGVMDGQAFATHIKYRDKPQYKPKLKHFAIV